MITLKVYLYGVIIKCALQKISRSFASSYKKLQHHVTNYSCIKKYNKKTNTHLSHKQRGTVYVLAFYLKKYIKFKLKKKQQPQPISSF